MYEQINERLSQSRQDMYRLEKIEAMLESLKRDTYALEDKARDTLSVLEKENRDYDKVMEPSISKIFYSVLGRLEERAEREHREVLEAELKYNQAVRELEDVRAQADKLRTEKMSLNRARENYESLYKQKLQMLMDENGGSAQKIMELTDRMEHSRKNLKEIEEAREAGGGILSSLDDALGSLDSAEGWGVFDMMGGGLISDIAKHSHIDDAGGAINRTQTLLRNFRTELADVSVPGDVHMEIDGFSKFADFFFDGLIADWFMQSKINATQESVKNTYRQVENVMRRLDELKTAEQKTVGGLQNELDVLVTMV